MNKVFVHMDEGWPEWCRTKRGGTGGGRVYHIRADYDPGNGAPWSLGCCAIEMGVCSFEVRPACTRTLLYMFTRVRQQGRDNQSAPICIWGEDGEWYIRIGMRILQYPSYCGVTLPEDRAEFIERIEEELDKVFPSEVCSFPHNNWRDIL
ncbi:hypothetical protein Roomu2_00124 [Pseudomonas phage vB_PpuM-Roomu-2]|uniref:Uncharacterized protein n=1 Tax=Pseudomonas phage vB_PpuM-Roomu-2 TaxID=3132621 RepID=A0AAX4N0T9_9CAUD